MRTETRRTVGQDAALTVAALLLVLVAISGLGPLVQGGAWWAIAASVAAATMLAGLGLRAARVPNAIVPLLEVLVVLAMLTLYFGAGTGILGILPSLDTFTIFGELANAAGRSVQQQAAPAIAVPGLLYALALGAGLIAVLTDILVSTLRMPAVAAVAVSVPILITVFIVGDGSVFFVLVLTAVSYLLLLRIDVRVRRSGAAAGGDPDDEDAPRVSGPKRVPVASTVGASLGIAGVGLVSAALLAASVPSLPTGFFAGAGQGPAVFGSGVSTLVDLGRDLRRPAARQVLHYTVADGSRPYLTLLTLDRLEDRVWLASDQDLVEAQSPEEIPAPPGLAEEVPRTEVEVRVWIDGLDSSWLPQPYPTSSISGLEGNWFWDAETRNVRSADASTDGQTYTLQHLRLEPEAEQLRDASRSVPAEVTRYLELPGEVPEIITETARQVTAGAASPYDAATQLQRFFRSALFAYSTDAPVEAGYDGGSLDVIGTFLQERSGYCVHFASAMAVMARELGIPARIALGYAPGEASGDEIAGLTRRDVDSHDLHTWPELYFEGVGWLPFEPTPGRGVVPSYSLTSTPETPEETTAPTAPASPPPSSGAEGQRPDLDFEDEAGMTGDGVGTQNAAATGRVLAVVGGVLVLLLTPAGIRLVRRLRRLRRVRAGGADAAGAAWDEVHDTAVDFGESPLPTATARGFAGGLRERPAFADPAVAAALDEVLGAVERRRYAPPDRPSPVDEAAVRTVLGALRADAGGRTRLLAVVAPPSLLSEIRSMTTGGGAPNGA